MNKYKITFLLVVLLMRIGTSPTANLSYLLLALFACSGKTQAIQALALSWLFTMLNPGIAAPATLAAEGRYVVVFGAAVSMFFHSKVIFKQTQLRWPVKATLLLGIFFIVHSLLFSPIPDVSILKATSWTMVMVTLLSGWLSLSVQEQDKLAMQLLGGLIVVLLVSLPLLLHPVGYLRNGTGFQGVLNHPQVFGPAMALLGAWAASLMFARSHPTWPTIILVGASLVMVLLSEARTAGLALVLGLGLAVIAAPRLSGQRLFHVLPGLRSRKVWSILALAILIGVFMAPRIGDIVHHFISKSGRAGEVVSVIQAYQISRGKLIDKMWSNIAAQPLTGIGFGIASNPDQMQIKRDPLFGLPVGAAIEKGVMPLAVFEELGLFGVVLVTLWFWMVVRRAAFGGVTPLAVTLTALLLNMGEANFFSPGGMGLLSLILVAWAFGGRKIKDPK